MRPGCVFVRSTLLVPLTHTDIWTLSCVIHPDKRGATADMIVRFSLKERFFSFDPNVAICESCFRLLQYFRSTPSLTHTNAKKALD